MHKKIISIIFILVILIAGNMSYSYNSTSYSTNKYNTSSSYNNTTESTTAITQTNGEYQLIIEDDANLLTGSQKELLEQEMAKLTEYKYQ